MKLLFTTALYKPYVSGITVYIQRLAEALVSAGYPSYILTSQHNKGLPLRENKNDVTIFRVPYVYRINKGFIMPSYLWNNIVAIKKVDVVIINLPQLEGCITALIAKLFGKKIICIYHCEITSPKNIPGYFIGACLFVSHILCLYLSEKIITYTQDYADHSSMLRLFKQKVVCIYPPIIKAKINKQIQKNILQSFHPRPKYLIGLAARISSEKGFEYLFQAIPYLQQKLGSSFSIIIAGPRKPIGEEKYLVYIDTLLQKYKNHIYFFETILSEEMGSFYSLLDVLVLPSINSTEAFGMVQVEAMLHGVPVVATDLPGVRVPIQVTGMGKLVAIKNSQKLAEAIVDVLHYRRKYTTPNRRIKDIFSLKKTIEMFVGVVHNL